MDLQLVDLSRNMSNVEFPCVDLVGPQIARGTAFFVFFVKNGGFQEFNWIKLNGIQFGKVLFGKMFSFKFNFIEFAFA